MLKFLCLLMVIANAEIKTDRGVYPEPGLPSLPAAGGTFVDPTFGTTLIRVTDHNDGTASHTAYSYWPTFNCNSTRFHLSSDGSARLYGFNPDSFRITGSEQALFASAAPQGGTPNWEDAIWSSSDPDVIYAHTPSRLYGYNVSTRSYTLLRDFSSIGNVRQMSKSADDNVFAFTRQDASWNVTGFLVYRRDLDSVILNHGLPAEDLDEVQVDKSGQYLLVKTAAQGSGVVQAIVINLNTLHEEPLIDNAPDFAPGHSDNGTGFAIGADNWQNRLTRRNLATPHTYSTVLALNNDWSQDCHISMLADNEAWVCMSFYTGGSLPGTGVFKNEIVLISTDGTENVRRVAHHRTVYADYWDSPRANISKDGRFVAFTSNWGASLGSDRRDVFILNLTDLAGQLKSSASPVVAGTAFTLSPNPFRNALTIGFQADLGTPVISIYNIAGCRVWRFAGQHGATWSPGALPSGAYVIEFKQGETVSTARALRVK